MPSYPAGLAMLSLLPLAMRMGGPCPDGAMYRG